MRKIPIIFVSFFLFSGITFLVTGCGSSDGGGCEEGEEASLTLTPSETPAVAYADGKDTIRINISGQDANCDPLAGAQIDLRITDADPENVGAFISSDSQNATVTLDAFGGNTEIKSSVPGTARVTAFCSEHNLTAAPVEITFDPPPVTGQCAAALEVDPSVIAPDGISTSVITATLTNDTGGNMPDGTEVHFTTTLGSFIESSTTNHTAETTGSVATVTLKSEVVADDTDVTVTATFTCDDGEQYAGDEQVRFGELNNPSINLRASSNSVFADDISSADLTAEVYLPGGARAGEGIEVDFLTDYGRFEESGNLSYIAYTDANGEATATFIGGINQGEAHITAGVFIDQKNAYDEVFINIRALGSIQFISATPQKLGVKGSGRDESSTIIFALLDTEDNPFPAGALVTFTNSFAPGVNLDPTTARTNDQGRVTTTLNAGRQASTVTVTATAQVGAVELESQSPAIAIVGAKPSARYLTFWCEYLNVGGIWVENETTECTVALADRFSNKIGFATNVLFKTEAGAIDAEALTQPDGSNMGLASVTQRTQNPRPRDVPYIGGEPYVVIDASTTVNPRDGLVNLIAVTTGEEEFTDTNGNGLYDDGEPFVDEGEPFVDENDNGAWDPNETHWIDSNGNSQYDGPNGEWDSDTLIWEPAWILWHGEMKVSTPNATNCALAPSNRFSIMCPPTFNIAKTGSQTFYWEVKDVYLNPLNQTCTIDINIDGKGKEGTSSPPLSYSAPDTLGGAGNEAYWTDCGGGFCGWVTINGADDNPEDPPEGGMVSLEVSYDDSVDVGDNNNVAITVSGTFQ